MIFKHRDHVHTVWMGDDGSLDTIFIVDGKEFRYNSETVERNPTTHIVKADAMKETAVHLCESGILYEEWDPEDEYGTGTPILK